MHSFVGRSEAVGTDPIQVPPEPGTLVLFLSCINVTMVPFRDGTSPRGHFRNLKGEFFGCHND